MPCVSGGSLPAQSPVPCRREPCPRPGQSRAETPRSCKLHRTAWSSFWKKELRRLPAAVVQKLPVIKAPASISVSHVLSDHRINAGNRSKLCFFVKVFSLLFHRLMAQCLTAVRVLDVLRGQHPDPLTVLLGFRILTVQKPFNDRRRQTPSKVCQH